MKTFVINFLSSITLSSKFSRLAVRVVSEIHVFLLTFLIWQSHFNLHFSFTYVACLTTCWTILYLGFGLQRDRIRYASFASYIPIGKLAVTFVVILMLLNKIYLNNPFFYESATLSIWLINILIALRFSVRQLVRKLMFSNRMRVLIYGVSDSAIDLLNALAYSRRYQVVGFLCEQHANYSGNLAGYPVIKIGGLREFVKKTDTKMIVLTSSQEGEKAPKELLKIIDNLGLSSSYAPSMDKAFDYEVQLRAVDPADVLGREEKRNFEDKSLEAFCGKTVLVTGAGGSIGSELCTQLIELRAEKYIFLDHSEIALHDLEHKLGEIERKSNVSVNTSYILGSIADEDLLSEIFALNTVHLVYHAAAYKHVPMIESNPRSALLNNVFGTYKMALFSVRYSVEKFVLVSTDKAVRPTNVMGATKRLAELVCQCLNNESDTVFTAVRFGNVLGSSGSVIPKFKEQIKSGGPVLVTHPEITRYFMSIPEAASLIIIAGRKATGGEVFLLDMGEPVKILDLAKSMIRQHGLRPNEKIDYGQNLIDFTGIDIKITGLRPGEKLYEELLIEDNVIKTDNPKIFCARDPGIDRSSLEHILSELSNYMKDNDFSSISTYLKTLPIGYTGMIDDLTELQIQKA